MSIIQSTQRLIALAALSGAALLAGCASLHSVDTSVATFGAWPADAAPGTYAFDRLPSQEKNLQRQQSLENAAAQALAMAGFRPAADGAKPAVMIQIGARIERFEQAPWDDPFWWGGPRRFGYAGWAPYGAYGPWGPWGGYGGLRRGVWAPFPPQPDVYQREVALLIRDASTGKALYETRASSDGYQRQGAQRARRAAACSFGHAAGSAGQRLRRLSRPHLR
jgi:outer membrane murein-binding lipoprotein Lpp